MKGLDPSDRYLRATADPSRTDPGDGKVRVTGLRAQRAARLRGDHSGRGSTNTARPFRAVAPLQRSGAISSHAPAQWDVASVERSSGSETKAGRDPTRRLVQASDVGVRRR